MSQTRGMAYLRRKLELKRSRAYPVSGVRSFT